MNDVNICPRDYYCSDGSPSYSAIPPALYNLPAYVALVSGSLSLIGAALNMIAYCAFKDLRKGTAQTIIAVLAMADFVLALSSLFGASIHLAYRSASEDLLSNKHCYNFDTLCQIQAFVGMWMLGCSLTWTSVLALHFFLVTVCTRSTWPHRLMPLYNIVAWLVPLSYSLSMLLRGELGHAPNLTWSCFMRRSRPATLWWCIAAMLTVVCMFLGYTCVLVSVYLKSVSTGCYTCNCIRLYISSDRTTCIIHT